MDFLSEYAIFLAKTVTFVIAGLVLLAALASLGSKGRRNNKGQLQVTHLNKSMDAVSDILAASILNSSEKKDAKKHKKNILKASKKLKAPKKRIFLLDFDGDMKASAAENLREEITAVLNQATPEDEVVIRLESTGGMVHSYGFASSQLHRIKKKAIPLTVCVDKVAASGGYMMACVASKIFCAPFAFVGSIGVVAQLPNFNRLLKKHDIDVELHTAGAYKRTLTIFGENTTEGRAKFVENLDKTHELFKKFVSEHRSGVDINDIATGEVWLGTDAKLKGLVDDIMTSDEYLVDRATDTEIYQVKYIHHKSLSEKMGLAAEGSADRLLLKWWNRLYSRQSFF